MRKKKLLERLLLFDTPAALEAYRKAFQAAATDAEREAAVRASGAIVKPVPSRRGRPATWEVVTSAIQHDLLMKRFLESGMTEAKARKAALRELMGEVPSVNFDDSKIRVRRFRAKRRVPIL